MRVHTLDLLHRQYERAIAAYLVEGDSGWVLIETGPMSTLDTLIQRLQQHGVAVGDIKDLFVTHIHLDHAGAAGWWAQQGATVHVHHVGAPHIIDPSRLWTSASRIYGDSMEALWGGMAPAPEDRVHALQDGDVVTAAGLTITALDTPGHAWHHHTYQIGNVAFTGDVAGVRLTPEEWVSLPAPPPEFNLPAWQSSLARLRALQLDALYLTHFGKVDDPDAHLQQLGILMEEATSFIRREMESGTERDALLQAYREWNAARAQQMGTNSASFEGRYEAANPLFMSVDGIMRYWRKQEEKAKESSSQEAASAAE